MPLSEVGCEGTCTWAAGRLTPLIISVTGCSTCGQHIQHCHCCVNVSDNDILVLTFPAGFKADQGIEHDSQLIDRQQYGFWRVLSPAGAGSAPGSSTSSPRSHTKIRLLPRPHSRQPAPAPSRTPARCTPAVFRRHDMASLEMYENIILQLMCSCARVADSPRQRPCTCLHARPSGEVDSTTTKALHEHVLDVSCRNMMFATGVWHAAGVSCAIKQPHTSVSGSAHIHHSPQTQGARQWHG